MFFENNNIANMDHFKAKTTCLGVLYSWLIGQHG